MVRGFNENDRRLNVKKIALKAGISVRSVETIIVDEMEFRKRRLFLCVPYFLTNHMKQKRLEASQGLLKRFQAERANLLYYVNYNESMAKSKLA